MNQDVVVHVVVVVVFVVVVFVLLIIIIGLMIRVFANGPEDQGSITGRVIPKTQKLFLMPPFLTLSIIR